MPSRTALIFAFLCAALASAGVFTANERDGDPEDRLQDLKAAIATVPKLLEKHTIRIRPQEAPKPEASSRSGYVLEKPDGTKLVVDAPKSVTPKQLEIAADSMATTGRKAFIAVDSAWKDAEGWWLGLTWSNQRLAERQTLAQFPSKPTAVSSYDWGERYQDGELKAEEARAFNLRRAGYAVGTLAGVFASVLLLLAVFAWLWRALLARVREFSQAVRGEGPK